MYTVMMQVNEISVATEHDKVGQSERSDQTETKRVAEQSGLARVWNGSTSSRKVLFIFGIAFSNLMIQNMLHRKVVLFIYLSIYSFIWWIDIDWLIDWINEWLKDTTALWHIEFIPLITLYIIPLSHPLLHNRGNLLRPVELQPRLWDQTWAHGGNLHGHSIQIAPKIKIETTRSLTLCSSSFTSWATILPGEMGRWVNMVHWRESSYLSQAWTGLSEGVNRLGKYAACF